MSKKKLRVVHYMNQFFGQIGGEEKADVAFSVKEGPVGPAMLLQKILGEDGTVVATIICGDNYFATNLDRASQEALELVEPFKPDLLFAGAAFAAGRYGVNCGEFCKTVGGKLGIPAVTGMYQENPGVEIYRKDCYIAQTGDSAAKMPEAMQKCLAYFAGVDRTVMGYEGLIAAQSCLPNNETRDRYAADYCFLCRLWEAISPDPVLSPYEADYRWLSQPVNFERG